MSAEETSVQNSVPKKTESRRMALLRRMNDLLHELDHIRQEVATFDIPVTQEEVEPVIENLAEQKTTLLLEEPVADMENVLAIYNPIDGIVEKDGSVDAVTEKVILTLIQRGSYRTTLDLNTYEGNIALRFAIGDEHHGKTLGLGLLLISSLPKAANGAEWFVHIENGAFVFADSLKNFDEQDVEFKIEQLIEDHEELTIEALEGYYLFIGDSDKFTEFLKAPVKEADVAPELTTDIDMVDLTQQPSSDFLAKIGPHGRIRYRTSMADLKKQVEDKGLSPSVILNRINEVALERAADTDFVYAILR